MVLDGLGEAAELRVRHAEPVVREPLRRDVLARLRRQQRAAPSDRMRVGVRVCVCV